MDNEESYKEIKTLQDAKEELGDENELVKESLKKHLSIDVESSTSGYIKVSIYWDDDKLSSSSCPVYC